jgi:hypothetical protein
MQITAIGYERILDANSKQIKLQILNFKVGSGTNYSPVKEDTALHGEIVYEGTIGTVDVLTDEVMDFVCTVPVTASGLGPLFIGEIGLYIDDPNNAGVQILFALTCYAEPIVKQPGQIYKTHCVLLSPYLGSVVDLTLTWAMSLPRVNFYGDLPHPAKTGSNAYVVNHGITKDYSPTNTKIHPAIVTRYAMSDTGPLAWGLLNGSLLYQGTVTSVTSDVPETSPGAGDGVHNTFTLFSALIVDSPPPLISVDWAFMYIYSGRGKGQCRAIKYHSSGALTGKFEVLYEALSLLGATGATPESSDPCGITTTGTIIPTSQVVNMAANNEADKSNIIIWSLPYSHVAGLVYAGRWNIKNPDGTYAGAAGYPNNAVTPGSYYVIAVGGVLNNVAYQTGDWLVYEGTGLWDKIDNTELPYVLYKGLWDASSGVYPPATPTTIFTELRQGHYWKISLQGTMGGVHFNVGDYLIYEGNSTWGRIVGTRRAISAGPGIGLATDPATETITVTNTTQNVHSIAVSNSTPAYASQGQINMNALQDTLVVNGGTGVAVITDPVNKTMTITNLGTLLAYKTIASPGKTPIIAKGTEDVLNIAVGSYLTIALDNATNTVTLNGIAPPVSAEKLAGQYNLLAYDKTDAAAAHVLVPAKDMILGNALKLTFTSDPSNPVYVPYSDSNPPNVQFCSCTCTCTCTCPCTCQFYSPHSCCQGMM